jgi:ABC-type microcin C transport system permease subunit YejE
LLFIALAPVSWVGVARLVRGSVLSIRQQEYLRAAQCVGTPPGRIMLRHILPNLISPLVVMMAFAIPRMIIVEAILGYLGLGLRPTTDPESYFVKLGHPPARGAVCDYGSALAAIVARDRHGDGGPFVHIPR